MASNTTNITLSKIELVLQNSNYSIATTIYLIYVLMSMMLFVRSIRCGERKT